MGDHVLYNISSYIIYCILSPFFIYCKPDLYKTKKFWASLCIYYFLIFHHWQLRSQSICLMITNTMIFHWHVISIAWSNVLCIGCWGWVFNVVLFWTGLSDLFPAIVVSLNEPFNWGLWRFGLTLQEGGVVFDSILSHLHCIPVGWNKTSSVSQSSRTLNAY